MRALTVRLSDAKHERLKALAKRKKVSVNRLMSEIVTLALVQSDLQFQLEARANHGIAERGLELLDKLDI